MSAEASKFGDEDKQVTSVGDHGRRGLSNEEAERLYQEVGYNELEHVEISPISLFFMQFTGLMPYILELCCILALATEDWVDFAIIFIILLVNSILGYTEQIKAKEALDELTDKMERKIAVVRDGKAQQLLTRLLVPGDVILLVGGTAVPADVDWLEGDVLGIDTSAMTGESLPRNYPSEQYGKRILGGTTVLSGEGYCIVRKTGSNTEIGSSQEAVMKDKVKVNRSVFEERILNVVKITIACAVVDVIVILFVQGFSPGREQFRKGQARTLIQTILSILVASVPVALPLVLQVTMALGASVMARKYDSVVTALRALQDISSMTILCSDKTGTITTARMSIYSDSIWINEGFTVNDVVLYTRLSSNPDKEDDPIDRSCMEYYRRNSPDQLESAIKQYRLVRGVGFNPIYKRVLWIYHHPSLGEVTVAKGLPNKIIDTADGGEDDAEVQWKVENSQYLLQHTNEITNNFSKQGYKTIAVAVKVGNHSNFKLVAILPMIDPPRHDSARTIRRLLQAGVRVKMVTGDHSNIAIETARLVGLGTNFHTTREFETLPANQRDDIICDADGFSQVLPKDKRLIVKVLQDRYHSVVGMTGDGVNDVSALSAAQCGVAVHGATDAAKNAAAIILTSPGLSAIYSAIVESRRIFRKLRAYVVYRIAATIQIVVSLSLLIYIADCEIKPLMIVLLAMFNDITLIPIAYDHQKPSAAPDVPSVMEILYLSFVLGMIQTIFTMLWSFVSYRTEFFQSNFDIFNCNLQTQSAVWIELSVSTELLIFSTRAPYLIWNSYRPSLTLLTSVLLGCIVLSIFAARISSLGSLPATDILIIWFYSTICLIIVDIVKLALLRSLGKPFQVLEFTSVEEEEEHEKEEEEKRVVVKEEEKYREEEEEDLEKGRSRRKTLEMIETPEIAREEDKLILVRKTSSQLQALNRWIVEAQKAEPLKEEVVIAGGPKGSLEHKADFGEEVEVPPVQEEQEKEQKEIELVRTRSAPGALRRRYAPPREEPTVRLPPSLGVRDRIIVGKRSVRRGSWFDLRPRSISTASIMPSTPASLTLYPDLMNNNYMK